MSTKRLDKAKHFGPRLSRTDVEEFARDLELMVNEIPKDQLADLDKRIDDGYSGGFNHRDEANALVALAVRNGPIENLHGGRGSELLEDDTLSRMTDEEIKVVMVYATRMLAGLLRLRDNAPELYGRYVRAYGRIYCTSWEREK